MNAKASIVPEVNRTGHLQANLAMSQFIIEAMSQFIIEVMSQFIIEAMSQFIIEAM